MFDVARKGLRQHAAQGDCCRLNLFRHMQGSFQGSGWQRWLEVSAAVQDCKLASHARRATLNLQSARTVATAEVMPSPLQRQRVSTPPVLRTIST